MMISGFLDRSGSGGESAQGQRGGGSWVGRRLSSGVAVVQLRDAGSVAG